MDISEFRDRKNIADSYFAIDTAYSEDILNAFRKMNNNSNIIKNWTLINNFLKSFRDN